MNAELTILGSGTCVPNSSRFPSSYHLRIGNESIIVDLGGGSLQRLSECGIDYKGISRVFISHIHPDHISDILPLFQALNFTPSYKREEKLFLYGNSEVVEYIDKLLQGQPKMEPRFPYEIIELQDIGGLSIGDIRVTYCLTQHSAKTSAFRFEQNGSSIVYGADTGLCEEIKPTIKNADIGILECSFVAGHDSYTHMNVLDVAELAADVDIGNLIVTHLYPEVLSVSDEELISQLRCKGYKGKIIIPHDGQVISLVNGIVEPT